MFIKHTNSSVKILTMVWFDLRISVSVIKSNRRSGANDIITVWYVCSVVTDSLGVGAVTLQWRHNGRDGVSNHQPHDCLLNRMFRRRSKKTSKLRVTGLCAGNSPGTGEFPAQMASYAENVFIWWCHHDLNRNLQTHINYTYLGHFLWNRHQVNTAKPDLRLINTGSGNGLVASTASNYLNQIRLGSLVRNYFSVRTILNSPGCCK